MIVQCENCKLQINATDKYYGRRVKCPCCKNPLTVPFPEHGKTEPQPVQDFIVNLQVAEPKQDIRIPIATVVENTPMAPMPQAQPYNPNLVLCPDCGKQISRFAPACPQCGRPLLNATNTKHDIKAGIQKSKLQQDVGNAVGGCGFVVGFFSMLINVYLGIALMIGFAVLGCYLHYKE